MLRQSRVVRDGRSPSWTEDADAQLSLLLLSSTELQPIVEHTLLSQAGSDVLPALC